MVNISDDKILAIGSVLQDETRPLKERFRALFTLRNIGGPIAIQCISKCFADPSALLKHELAYCLGQMQDKTATEILVRVLEDVKQEPMVRHEAGEKMFVFLGGFNVYWIVFVVAAEALGAIGSTDALTVLEKFLNDPVIEVAETCQLAIERIKWLQNSKDKERLSENPYNSVDPAPPATETDVPTLKTTLLNENAPLFQRYRAMFSLRNLRTKEAVQALGSALKCGSALFRHEIAFVLGQLQDENGVPYLRESLQDSAENEMVRHECAEALGAIANQECFDVLNEYLRDEKRVVKESCEIALDMCDYENSPEFQYANTLVMSAWVVN